ncbi:hypothetical protein KM043_015968 [Ampulex compressa]|nr:hypothetical protein KM043_015968 [Ampulex compressa]
MGSRFSFIHEGNFYCIDVAPVTIEDEGHWTCMAENKSGRSSCTSRLSVIVPKAYKKPEFVEELRALLTEMGTVSLECKVIGVPTPVLRWFKDDKEIKAGDVFALTANPDDPTSLGIYTCEAINCMGTAYSSSKVHVVGKGSREGSLKPADTMTPSGPLPVFKRILQDECCRIGETLALSCQVQVPPWPREITWYNKEGRVDPSDKYHVMEDGLGGYSIEVKPIEAMDEGEWKCVATSTESMKQFTTCYVAMSIPKNYRKPRFMESLKAVLTEEGLVSFECKVVGFPTPLLRWFKDGQELKPGDVYQLTGTNSLGSYCCIAKNCMGEAKSTAELTIEDIQNQLNEEERLQLLSTNQPPNFVKGLRSCEAKINEDFKLTVQVSVAPEPSLSWYRDDTPVDKDDKYRMEKENLGTCHLEIQKLEFVDQAEWKCVATNDFGHSVTSCFLKLIIPKHYKKPKFLESLRAILSEEGAVNLECKVIGVPQPILKWYKDGVELKPGDIHRIISGQDGTCCLGTYTCEATNCMGTVSSSASLLGFEDKLPVRKEGKEIPSAEGHELARNLSLSTIHEERTSQMYDTPQTDHSVTLDDRGEVSFSFDGKEVSVSLYETPDLTEEEALQIVEMYADQLSEHVTEHNVIELPPMRFMKETSTSGNLLMEAVVIDVAPDYFVSARDDDDLRTEADFEDVSIMDDLTRVFSSPEQETTRSSLKRSIISDEDKPPKKPPRRKSQSFSSSRSDKSEKSQRLESESFHSARKEERPISPPSLSRQDDSDTFADALSSARLSISENQMKERKRSTSEEKTAGSSIEDGIPGEFSLESESPIRRKHRRKKRRKESSKESSIGSDTERSKSPKQETHQEIESLNKIGEPERKARTSDSEGSLNRKQRLLKDIQRLKEPVLAVRDALVDINITEIPSESENLDKVEKIVAPIQSLCDEVSAIESKALKSAGDKSFSQSIRISFLEAISGPTEELLRGVELMQLRESTKTKNRDCMAILESLTDPVDEILSGLTRIEHELTGRAIPEKPISLVRITRAVTLLRERTKRDFKKDEKVSSFEEILDILNFYLQDINIDPVSGTMEAVDTVVIESLSKCMEDMLRIVNRFLKFDKKNLHELSHSFSDMKTKLETVSNTLQSYETEETSSQHRAKLMNSLKSTLNRTIKEIHGVKKTRELEGPSKESILEAPCLALQEALESYKIISGHLDPRLCSIFDQVSNLYSRLKSFQKVDRHLEMLLDLQEPLHSLQSALCHVENPQTVFELLCPSINELTVVAKKEESLQPILCILTSIDNLINTSKIEKQDKPILEETRHLAEEILDPLIDVQSAISATLRPIEESVSLTKDIQSSKPLSTDLINSLDQLRQYVSEAVHTAMTLKEDETVFSLLDLQEPLMELNLALISNERNSREIPTIQNIAQPIEKLKQVIVTVQEQSHNPEVTNTMSMVSRMLDEIQEQSSKVLRRLTKMGEAERPILSNLNIDRDLSNVHFALSSALERRENSMPVCITPLLACIEDLRQSIGSTAVDISSLDNPTDDKIMRRVSGLKQTLLNLQRILLTEDHAPEEEQILKDLVNPIGILKNLVQDIIKNSASAELMFSVLELLEEIEKDTPLVVKQASKKKAQLEESRKEAGLASRIKRSLDPIKNWLSSEESARDEDESGLSSPIDDLKRNVTRIAIESSYSDPPTDESLIEALVELREPLMRLRNAISTYHEPHDLDTLESLGKPMKYLLGTILDVLQEHADEESLRPIVEIVEEIENQIPLSIKEALYKKELKVAVESLGKSEVMLCATSQETIPEGTLAESTLIVPESSMSSTEQITKEEMTYHSPETLTSSVETLETMRLEKDAEKGGEAVVEAMVSFASILESIQLEVTSILEDFEQPTTSTVTPPTSKLASSLEELGRTMSTIRAATTLYDSSISSHEKTIKHTMEVLNNLLEPLSAIQEILGQTHEQSARELLILNRLEKPLTAIEKDLIYCTRDIANKFGITPMNYAPLLEILQGIKNSVPVITKDITRRQEILDCVREITKPLESIQERMKNLETLSENTLETDVARILVQPMAEILMIMNNISLDLPSLGNRKKVIDELRGLIEPSVEFLSCLSVVQSSRKSLVPEVALLEERKNVILKASEGLQKQIIGILKSIEGLENACLFEKPLTSLNTAISSVQKQIGKTDYSRRPSHATKSLCNRLSEPLEHLKSALLNLEEHADEKSHTVIWKSLEALRKQITLTQSQFLFLEVDEEAIMEGFFYPLNQLYSALSTLKEVMSQEVISEETVKLLKDLTLATSEFVSSLDSHRDQLLLEGTSNSASVVETLCAIVDVLKSVEQSISSIRETVTMEEERKMLIEEVTRSEGVPQTITVVETIIDEIIEISKDEVESILMVTEILSPEEETKDSNKQESHNKSSSDQPTSSIPVVSNETEDKLSKEQDEITEVIAKRRKSETPRSDSELKVESEDATVEKIRKIISLIATMKQPLQELKEFIQLALKRPLTSKSEEEKRKIRELTALVQILNDLRATNTSICCTIATISPLKDPFISIMETCKSMEGTVGNILDLTKNRLTAELKNNVLVSLRLLLQPFESLQTSFELVRSLALNFESEYRESAIAMIDAQKRLVVNVIEIINTIQESTDVGIAENLDIASLTEEQVNVAEDTDMTSATEKKVDVTISSTKKETNVISRTNEEADVASMASKEMSVTTSTKEEADVTSLTKKEEDVTLPMKEEPKNIEVTTARPLEELIEAIVVSQDRLEKSLDTMQSPESQQIINDSMSLEDSKLVQRITSPVKHLKESIAIIEEQRTEEEECSSFIERKAASAVLQSVIGPLEKLQRAMTTVVCLNQSDIQEISGEMQDNTSLPEQLSIQSTLQELEKSIAEIQNKTILESAGKKVLILETLQTSVAKEIECSLDDLKLSIATIQNIAANKHEILGEMSNVEKTLAVETFAKSVKKLEERCLAVAGRKTEILEGTQLGYDIVETLAETIQVLNKPIDEMEKQINEEVEPLMPSTAKMAVAMKSLVRPLEELKRSLCNVEQQGRTFQEQITGELPEIGTTTQQITLEPIFEDLQRSIALIEAQMPLEDPEKNRQDERFNESIVQSLERPLIDLKLSTATIQQIIGMQIEKPEELTLEMKTLAYQTFAKSVKQLGELCSSMITQTLPESMSSEIPKKTKHELTAQLLQEIGLPIQAIRESTIELNEQKAQISEISCTQEKNVASIVLNILIQPLQMLEKTLGTAVEERHAIQEDVAIESKRAKIPPKLEPVLQELEKSIVTIQEQVTPKSTTKMTMHDESVVKAMQAPLEELKTSLTSIQRLIQADQKSELSMQEEMLAIKTFAKSINEISEQCSAVIHQQKIEDAPVSKLKEAKSKEVPIETEVLERIIAPIQVLQETIYKLEDKNAPEIGSSETYAKLNALNVLIKPLNNLQLSISTVIEQKSQQSILLSELCLTPLLEDLQTCVITAQNELQLTSVNDTSQMHLLSIMDQPLKTLKSTIESLKNLDVIRVDEPANDSSIEKVDVLHNFEKSIKELGERCLAIVDKEKIQKIQVVPEEKNIAERKTEILEMIASPIEMVRESISRIQEKSIQEITITEAEKATPPQLLLLVQPLEKLKEILMTTVQEATLIKEEMPGELKKTPTLKQVTLKPILEELQRNVVMIQDQAVMQPEFLSSLEPYQKVTETVEELRMMVTAVQKISTMESERLLEFLDSEDVSALKSCAKSMEEMGEQYIATITQWNIKQDVQEKTQKMDSEALQKIIAPIQTLRATLSQMVEQRTQQTEKLQAALEEKGGVQLKVLIHPLQNLERALVTAVQQETSVGTEVTEHSNKNTATKEKLKLQPVFEELQRFVVAVQQQAIIENPTTAQQAEWSLPKIIEAPLENLKMSVATIRDIIEHAEDEPQESTTEERVSTLETFAKSVEEIGQLLIVAEQQKITAELLPEIVTEEPLWSKEHLMQSLMTSIRELQCVLSQLEEKKTDPTQVTSPCVLLTLMEPLNQLKESLSFTASMERIVSSKAEKKLSERSISFQELTIKPILDHLIKSISIVQEQVALAQGTLTSTDDTESVALIKSLTNSLGDLQTSVTIVQQLATIEEPGQQVLEVENSSALHTLSKAIEDFRKHCILTISAPNLLAALRTEAHVEQSMKVDMHVLESIVIPARILQEKISCIEDTKQQEVETLELVDSKKSTKVLDALVPVLHKLESFFTAAIQEEHVLEHDTESLESNKVLLEKTTLKPILQEFEKSIATAQEQLLLERGDQTLQTSAPLQAIAQTLIDLRTSVACVEQTTEMKADSPKEISKSDDNSLLETFAKSLHDLAEQMALVDHQQMILEPAADTISTDASSLMTWADVIEPLTVTRPMVIDHGRVESPLETVVSMSEEDSLKTLAKPLNELRECLALIVEAVVSNDTARSLSEDLSLLRTMAKPLLELRDAAVTVIQEQFPVESAKEKCFETIESQQLSPLAQPLEELCTSIAVVQEQMLVESMTDHQKDEILNALAEPLIDLQRSLSVLEERVMSPDVESIPEESTTNWITECLAVPLQEIERSIADIRECIVVEPEQSRIVTPEWKVIGRLIAPVEGIKSVISSIEESMSCEEFPVERRIEYEALRTLVEPLSAVQNSFSIFENSLNVANDEAGIEAIVDSLSNLEKSISLLEEQVIDKPHGKPFSIAEVDTTIFSILALPLTELKQSILTVEESPSVYLANLEHPLENLRLALEACAQRTTTKTSIGLTPNVTKLSIHLVKTILEINDSIESIERSNQEEDSGVRIEIESLKSLVTPLHNVKLSLARVLENEQIQNDTFESLKILQKSVAHVWEQSTASDFSEKLDIIEYVKPCLIELEKSIELSVLHWYEKSSAEGLVTLKNSVCKLANIINTIHEKVLAKEMLWDAKLITEEPRQIEVRQQDTGSKQTEKRTETEMQVPEKLSQEAEECKNKREQEQEHTKRENEKLHVEEEKCETQKAEKMKKEAEENAGKLKAERLQKEEEERKKQEAEKLHKEEEEYKRQEDEKLKKEVEERDKKLEIEELQKKEEEHKKQEAQKLQKEEDERKKQEEEKLKREAEERERKLEAERLQKEEEERKRQEDEKLKNEAEERKRKLEVEKLQKEEDERKKQEAKKLQKEEEELKKQKAEVREKKLEAEKLQKEEEERKKQEAEKLQKEEEERKRQEDEKLKKEAEERERKLEVERLEKEEEERKKREAEKLQQEEEERKRQEEEKLKKEAEERERKLEAERLEKEEEERKKRETEKLQKEEEERKRQEEEKLKKEAEERERKLEAERLQKEEEERKKQEAEKLQKEEEERKRQEEEKLKKEAEERERKLEAERLQKEEEERKKQEAEKLQKEEEERKRQEEEKLKKEAEERDRKLEAERLEKEEKERKKQEAEKLQKEEEERKRQEEEKLKKEAEERERKLEAEKLQKEEEERKKQETEKLQKEEEERKRQEEEKLKKEAEERERKLEAERLQKEEEERKKQEAEKLQKEEEERKRQEDEKLKKETEERERKLEAERLQKEEEERKKQEAEKLQKEEEERKRQEEEKLKKEAEERDRKLEAERLEKEEKERKKQEAEKLQKEEEERKRQEEEKLKKEAEERERKLEAEGLQKEEEERKKQEAEKLQKEEEERKRQEEEKLKKEAQEHERKLEAERLEKEEKERKKQEAEKLQKEEEKRKRQEEEKLKKEAEERERKLEAERLEKEEEERKKQEAEKLQKEEKDRKRQEDEKLKKETEERERKLEAERLQKEVEGHKKRKAEQLQIQDQEREKQDADKLQKEDEKHKAEETEKVMKEEKKWEGQETLEKEKGERKNRETEDTREDKETRMKGIKLDTLKKEKYSKYEELPGTVQAEEDELQRKERERLLMPSNLKNELQKHDKQLEERRWKTESVKKLQEPQEVESTLRKKQETYQEPKRKDFRYDNDLKQLRLEEHDQRLQKERMRKKEHAEMQWREEEDRLLRRETERLERRRADNRRIREETDRARREADDRWCRRETERRARRDESARSIREEEQRLRRRREEETYRQKRKRQERIEYEGWSKQRQRESECALVKLKDDRLKSSRLTRIIPELDYWKYRGGSLHSLSSMSTLSDASRSYSWRDSLSSLSRKKADDYFDYKLRDTSMDRYYFDTGAYYRKRRRRDDCIIRARSISLLKYEDYSTGDSDATITPSSTTRPPRQTRGKTSLRSNLDDYGYSSTYTPTNSIESLPQEKKKKPSFCTRLTNRTVGVGMRTRLTCTVIGHPEPRVYWTKDNQVLNIASSRYRTKFDNGMAYFELHEALPDDSGVYTCIAENIHGTSSTESILKVYSDFVPALCAPTFTKSIKDTYRYSDHELVLECRVRAHPVPTVTWLKDGHVLQGERYRQSYLDDGIYRLEITEPDMLDSGRYTCRATNDLHANEISHMVHFEEHDQKSTHRQDWSFEDDASTQGSRTPKFSSHLTDYSVPTGGTIALQVEVKGTPAPEVRWLYGDRREPLSISKARTFTESGVHTLVVPQATELERGTYICRAINAYGHVDTSATVDVISPSALDGGKPAMFVSRPTEKSITVAVGEDVSVSFRVNGQPKPRVTWMKGLRDITDGPRSHKEVLDDYVRLTLKRATPDDEGTYCILAKNKYGCDRSFFSIKIKQRARSLTPVADWSSITGRAETGSLLSLADAREDRRSYVTSMLI